MELFAIESPRPIPPVFLFLECSSLLKGSSASSLLSRGIPGPLSSITTSQ